MPFFDDLPFWVEPSAEYIFKAGLKGTLRIAAFSVVASAVVGIVLGTLLTIRFWPSRALIRLYIEVWRGLPIIVTLFLIYFALPRAVHAGWTSLNAFQAATAGLILWG